MAHKQIIVISFLAVSLLLAAGAARAEDFSGKPIKLLVGASPGGTTDTMARAIATPLSTTLGPPVIVENRPGAGGNLAADAVAKSSPDGSTLLVAFTSHTINATLYPKLPFDPVADFTPITMVATVPSLLVGHRKLPAQDLQALIALAKDRPDTLTIGLGGIGSSVHMAGEKLKMMTGIRLLNVPYKGFCRLQTIPKASNRLGQPLECAGKTSIFFHSVPAFSTPIAGTLPGHRG